MRKTNDRGLRRHTIHGAIVGASAAIALIYLFNFHVLDVHGDHEPIFAVAVFFILVPFEIIGLAAATIIGAMLGRAEWRNNSQQQPMEERSETNAPHTDKEPNLDNELQNHGP